MLQGKDKLVFYWMPLCMRLTKLDILCDFFYLNLKTFYEVVIITLFYRF